MLLERYYLFMPTTLRRRYHQYSLTFVCSIIVNLLSAQRTTYRILLMASLFPALYRSPRNGYKAMSAFLLSFLFPTVGAIISYLLPLEGHKTPALSWTKFASLKVKTDQY